LVNPNTDIDAPNRKHVRSDKELPKLMQSKTESDEPTRVAPYIDTAEPIRAKLRIDIAAPKVTKSRTDKDDPRSDKP
jgi:hypothetical protein